MARQRSAPDPDWTDTEDEGLPATEDQPPGIDAETAEEGTFPPRDHPVGAEEIGVTAAEERVPESLEERRRRERPQSATGPTEDVDGRLAEPEEAGSERELEGDWVEDAAGLSAEEQAVHVRER